MGLFYLRFLFIAFFLNYVTILVCFYKKSFIFRKKMNNKLIVITGFLFCCFMNLLSGEKRVVSYQEVSSNLLTKAFSGSQSANWEEVFASLKKGVSKENYGSIKQLADNNHAPTIFELWKRSDKKNKRRNDIILGSLANLQYPPAQYEYGKMLMEKGDSRGIFPILCAAQGAYIGVRQGDGVFEFRYHYLPAVKYLAKFYGHYKETQDCSNAWRDLENHLKAINFPVK